MYSTCLFCHGSLGANESIESFPVGRRLAFDAARGRLWVVCPACGRWNLSPLEERWEAVEQGERLFRDARLRAQTDEIGLAQLAEGTQLIRIGRPHRPEFAAWRYGDVLGVRRRRALRNLAGAGALLGGTGAAVGGFALGTALLIPAAAWVAAIGTQIVLLRHHYGVTTRIPAGGGGGYVVFHANLHETSLEPGEGPDGPRLHLRHATGLATLEGADARRALGLLLPRVNPMGAGLDRVRASAELIAREGGPDRLLSSVAAESARLSEGFLEERAAYRRDPTWIWRNAHLNRAPDGGPVNRGSLPRLPRELRLATEMAVHEESERLALEGELSRLEAEWREAEEIAAISDRLLTPPGVEQRLEELRHDAPRTDP